MYATQIVSFQLLLLNLDAVLLLRIMAVLLEIVTSVLTNGVAIVRASADSMCIVMDTPLVIIPTMVGITISQSMLLYLTYRGTPVIRGYNIARRHNMVSILIRDGAFVFGSLIIARSGGLLAQLYSSTTSVVRLKEVYLEKVLLTVSQPGKAGHPGGRLRKKGVDEHFSAGRSTGEIFKGLHPYHAASFGNYYDSCFPSMPQKVTEHITDGITPALFWYLLRGDLFSVVLPHDDDKKCSSVVGYPMYHAQYTERLVSDPQLHPLVFQDAAFSSACASALIAWDALLTLDDELLLLNLDVVLLLRRVAVLLEIVTSALTNGIGIFRASPDGMCIVMDTPLVVIPMMVGITISQSILLYLTYRGKPVMGSSNTAMRRNLAFVLIRDGAFVFGSLISLAMMCLLYLVINKALINVFYP
ncbi:hypothetical protein BU15DRAFT_68449 [Melanogaster broomeanus]|nr:hypothetical protein BU15DRAFT_68449 [Melanogaster broomeanus]